VPITINSKSCSNAGWWAKHVQKTETNERVEIIGFYDLSAETIEEAFSEMRLMAQGSEAKNFFSAYNINPRADEHLTEAQWDEAHALHRKNHGLDHLPYFRVRHIKDGREHEHGFALRVDPETEKAISDSLTAPINERTSRELEIRFGLERGHSVLTPNRDEPRPERQPKHWEKFRGDMSGLDPAAIGKELASIKQRSDNGLSFKAGMEAAGYSLGPGDRRDFVVIDRAGHVHSLGRRLGIKAAELRAFMKDIDRASLPTIEQAQNRQRARAAEIDQRRAAIGRYDDIRPEATARAAEQGKYAGAAHGRENETTPSDGPRSAPQPEIKPLGKTAGEIRLAWQTTKTPDQFAQALEDRGLILVHVSREEAEKSWRAAAFAKAIGRQSRALREGFGVVDQRGNVTRIDQRTTGDHLEEIRKRLDRIDKDQLASVAEAKEAQREASRADWIEQQEKARPASAIEQRIIDCREKAQQLGASVVRDDNERIMSDTEAYADRFKPDDERRGELHTIYGPEAFAARLDQAGFAIVRVTASDIEALAELRAEENLAREIARTNNEAYRTQHFAERLEAGDIAAVTKQGDVYQLNPHRLDLEHIAASLESAARDGMLGNSETLPSMTEARVAFLIERNAEAALREEAREEAQEARIDRSAAWDAERETSQAVAAAERDAGDVMDAAEDMVDGGAAGIGRVVEKMAGLVLGFLADLIAPTKLTKEQRKQMQQDAEFRADLAAWGAEQAAQADQQDEARRKARAEREAEEEERARQYERQRERERDPP
jgi:hypothetical protein